MEIDNFGDISDSDDSMPDLEDLHGDTTFDDPDHQVAVQNQCGLAPPILRPVTPNWQKSMENGSENLCAHPGMEVPMNIDQDGQSHALPPTKPYVSILDYDDELNALVDNSISEFHRIKAIESQQVHDRQDQQLTDKNQSGPAPPTIIQFESAQLRSDNPNEHPIALEGNKTSGNQNTEIYWDFDMDTQTFVRIDRPLRKSDPTSSMTSALSSPQMQLAEKNKPGPTPPVVIPVTPIRTDQIESDFQDEIVHGGMHTKSSVPAPGHMSFHNDRSSSATPVIRPSWAAGMLPNSKDDHEKPGMVIGNSAPTPSYMSLNQNRPAHAPSKTRLVTQNQKPPISQNKGVHQEMRTMNSAPVSGNLWFDRNQHGPAPPKLVTPNSGDEVEYLGSFIRSKTPRDLSSRNSQPRPGLLLPAAMASNSPGLNGNPGPSPPFIGRVEVMDLTSPLPSPPPFTLPPEVTATDSQARIKQLNELYMWQSKQTDIWKRKTDEMQMYCEKQYQEKMVMQKEMKVLTARLSLFDESVSIMPSSFEEVLKEWEQSEFKDKKMEGIDLNLFLFNPKGVQTIPQVVRRPVSCYNLFRIHFHLKNDPEALRQEWKLMKFQSRDKIWFGNCEWINKWQKMQELKGWIRPIKVKESTNSFS